jgi:hypothetical protein
MSTNQTRIVRRPGSVAPAQRIQPRRLRMSTATNRAITWAFFAVMAASTPSAAETVVVVPYAQQNKNLPHPAHSGAPITLKAIVRGLTCNQGYDVTWDVNLDRQYTPIVNGQGDGTFTYPRTQDTLWDIGRTWTVPIVPFDQPQNVGVQVRNRCTNAVYTGSFPIYIYAFQPPTIPVNGRRTRSTSWERCRSRRISGFFIARRTSMATIAERWPQRSRRDSGTPTFR